MKTKLFKKISATAMAAVIASSALVTPTAHAVIPDSRAIIGGIGAWSAANVIKEYLDWRAFGGWGAVGMTNTVITVMRGDSQGAITKAAFTELCGATAAGVLANWKPISSPTVASHAKAIVKAGSVAGVASGCGWVTQFIFEAVDRNTVAAQAAINGSTPTQKQLINSDATNWNQHLTNMEKQARDVALTMDRAAAALRNYTNLGCRSQSQSVDCQFNWNTFQDYSAASVANVNALNAEGPRLTASLKKINTDIKG